VVSVRIFILAFTIPPIPSGKRSGLGILELPPQKRCLIVKVTVAALFAIVLVAAGHLSQLLRYAGWSRGCFIRRNRYTGGCA